MAPAMSSPALRFSLSAKLTPLRRRRATILESDIVETVKDRRLMILPLLGVREGDGSAEDCDLAAAPPLAAPPLSPPPLPSLLLLLLLLLLLQGLAPGM
jgi:hypothetical protein